jgi:hypothetical protein
VPLEPLVSLARSVFLVIPELQASQEFPETLEHQERMAARVTMETRAMMESMAPTARMAPTELLAPTVLQERMGLLVTRESWDPEEASETRVESATKVFEEWLEPPELPVSQLPTAHPEPTAWRETLVHLVLSDLLVSMARLDPTVPLESTEHLAQRETLVKLAWLETKDQPDKMEMLEPTVPLELTAHQDRPAPPESRAQQVPPDFLETLEPSAPLETLVPLDPTERQEQSVFVEIQVPSAWRVTVDCLEWRACLERLELLERLESMVPLEPLEVPEPTEHPVLLERLVTLACQDLPEPTEHPEQMDLMESRVKLDRLELLVSPEMLAQTAQMAWLETLVPLEPMVWMASTAALVPLELKDLLETSACLETREARETRDATASRDKRVSRESQECLDGLESLEMLESTESKERRETRAPTASMAHSAPRVSLVLLVSRATRDSRVLPPTESMALRALEETQGHLAWWATKEHLELMVSALQRPSGLHTFLSWQSGLPNASSSGSHHPRVNQWNSYVAHGIAPCQDVQFSINEVNTFLDSFDQWVTTQFNNLDVAFGDRIDSAQARYNSEFLNFQLASDAKYATILAQVDDIKAQIQLYCW